LLQNGILVFCVFRLIQSSEIALESQNLYVDEKLTFLKRLGTERVKRFNANELYEI